MIEVSHRRLLLMPTKKLSAVGSKLLRRGYVNDLLFRLAVAFRLLCNYMQYLDPDFSQRSVESPVRYHSSEARTLTDSRQPALEPF